MHFFFYYVPFVPWQVPTVLTKVIVDITYFMIELDYSKVRALCLSGVIAIAWAIFHTHCENFARFSRPRTSPSNNYAFVVLQCQSGTLYIKYSFDRDHFHLVLWRVQLKKKGNQAYVTHRGKRYKRTSRRRGPYYGVAPKDNFYGETWPKTNQYLLCNSVGGILLQMPQSSPSNKCKNSVPSGRCFLFC